MVKQKRLYTVLSAVIGIVILYSLSMQVYYSVRYSSFNAPILLSLTFSIFSLTSIAIALSTHFKKAGLLRLFLCIEVFSFPFSAFFYISILGQLGEFKNYKPGLSPMLLFSLLLTLIVTACSGILLWHLSREKKARITFVQYGEERFGQFEPAGKGLRLINRLIDSAVILYYLFSRIIEGGLIGQVGRHNEYLVLLLMEGISIIVFYLLLEGIFNTTPGKCATDTVIVNENGERPSFSQILGRSFARLIPFDALSFLGARGWHDSLSGTWVVPAAGNEMAAEEITLDAEQNLTQ